VGAAGDEGRAAAAVRAVGDGGGSKGLREVRGHQQRGDPDVAAEYADVRFTVIMEGGRRARGDVRMVGSFNNWMHDSAVPMEWNEIDGQYETTLRLKQGQYEYRYLTDDPFVQEAMQGATPQRQNLYTSLIYFDDITAHTDRLIAVRGMLVR